MRGPTIFRLDHLKRTLFLFIIFIVGVLIFSVRANYKYLHYQFNGVVDSIRHGDKDTPCVIIKGEEYFLDEFAWDHIITKGDSMIKHDNSKIIKLVKPNGRTIVKGEDN